MRAIVAAARPIFEDSIGVLVFALLMALHAHLALGVAIGTAVALALLLRNHLLGRPIGTLQWVSLAILVASGATALVLHDARFVAIKPSIMYAVLGIILLRHPGWMLAYVPPAPARWLIPHEIPLLHRLGRQWSALMLLTSLANAVVALRFPHRWPAFIGLFPLLSKSLLFAGQYAVLRARVATRRLLAA